MPKHKRFLPKFDNKISLGVILTALTLLGSTIGSYRALKENDAITNLRLSNVEEALEQIASAITEMKSYEVRFQNHEDRIGVLEKEEHYRRAR